METYGSCFFSGDEVLLLEAGKRVFAMEVFKQIESSGSLQMPGSWCCFYVWN